jgi:magnesium transporter
VAMLSEFLRFALLDEHGRPAHLVDLAVDLAGDYPPVTQLVLQQHRHNPQRLPWDTVAALDWHAHTIRVTDLDAATPAPPEAFKDTVLLKRDVLDALVLDLESRHAALANDLWLRESDGQLALRGADVSPWAILRRLSRGWLGSGTDHHLLDWQHVEFLRGDPHAARAGGNYHRRVARLPPGQIARLMDALPYLHATELLALLPDPVAANVLEVMTPERQLQVFEELTEAEANAVRLLVLMAPDVATDLIGRVPTELAQQVLEQLPAPKRAQLIDLLRYPEDLAGGIMTNDVVVVPITLTIAQARAVVRDQLKEPGFVYYLYVVDDAATRRLRGVITVRDLLIADDTCPLEELMQADLETIDPLEPARAAAQRVIDNSLAALPVVAHDGRLLGAITADAAVAKVAPRAWREQAPRVFS